MGNYLVFEINKFHVRREMQAFIRTRRIASQAVTIKIFRPENNPDFRRIEKREIIYKGLLYDVIKEVKQGQNITFTCIRDHKEEMLIAGFKKSSTRKVTLALIHNLITQALPVEMTRKVEQPAIIKIFPENFSRVEPGHLSRSAPPPEFA
jgi:hypothetical protein